MVAFYIWDHTTFVGTLHIINHMNEFLPHHLMPFAKDCHGNGTCCRSYIIMWGDNIIFNPNVIIIFTAMTLHNLYNFHSFKYRCFLGASVIITKMVTHLKEKIGTEEAVDIRINSVTCHVTIAGRNQKDREIRVAAVGTTTTLVAEDGTIAETAETRTTGLFRQQEIPNWSKSSSVAEIRESTSASTKTYPLRLRDMTSHVTLHL